MQRPMSILGMDHSAPLLSMGIDAPADAHPEGLARLRFGSLRLKGLVVAQFPNAPIAIWITAAFSARLLSGDAESVALAIASVALTAWAYLELAEGVNWFRRLLGATVIVYVVVDLADALPA